MQSISEIVTFLKTTYATQGKTRGVIAVSGGIDSALSLTLLTRALGPESVYPLFLPYGEQSVVDSLEAAKWNAIPEKNWKTVNIQPAVDILWETFSRQEIGESIKSDEGGHDKRGLRKGNIQARVRMIAVFDRAKELDALVCGTENKSEHYLGYFTRFGDAASDIEPISGLYKTQVREMVRELGMPPVFLEKAPSAGLWEDQTDEKEMGFSYEDADNALAVILGEREVAIDPKLLEKVKKQKDAMAFKLQVPYELHSN